MHPVRADAHAPACMTLIPQELYHWRSCLFQTLRGAAAHNFILPSCALKVHSRVPQLAAHLLLFPACYLNYTQTC